MYKDAVGSYVQGYRPEEFPFSLEGEGGRRPDEGGLKLHFAISFIKLPTYTHRFKTNHFNFRSISRGIGWFLLFTPPKTTDSHYLQQRRC
jgi:hypothetical protein